MALIETLHRWIQPHANAIAVQSRRSRWFPIINLVWLFWMVGAPWFFSQVQWRVVVLTYLSVPVFLWLYFQCWYGDRRYLARRTVAIAVLGLAMVLVNTSWSYLIYAAVLIPYCTRGYRVLLWLAVLMALFYGVQAVMAFPPLFALGSVVSCIALASINWLVRVSQERDAELRLSHEEVRRLAAMSERERISRDLHDLLGHTLSMVALKSELAGKLIGRDDDAARREIGEVQRVAREALAEVRSAVTGMRAAGLAAELASSRLLLEGSGVRTTIDTTELALPAALEAALALVIREAVTNIHRHAQATTASIGIKISNRQLLLTIHDDGRGGVTTRGNGLKGLTERIEAVGGHLQVESPRSAGTTLTVQLPLPKPDAVMPVQDAGRAA